MDRIVYSFGCIFYNAMLHARNCAPPLYFILQLPLLRSFIVCNIIFSIIHLRSPCIRVLSRAAFRVVYRVSWLGATRVYTSWQFLSFLSPMPILIFSFQYLTLLSRVRYLGTEGGWGITGNLLVGTLSWQGVPYRVPQTLFYFICCQFTSHSVSHVTREAAVFRVLFIFSFLLGVNCRLSRTEKFNFRYNLVIE